MERIVKQEVIVEVPVDRIVKHIQVLSPSWLPTPLIDTELSCNVEKMQLFLQLHAMEHAITRLMTPL